MKLADLAPLHNPPSLETLAAAEAALPHVPHVAVFDTAFHATLAPAAYTYPLPAKWTRDWGIRRYGFHGLESRLCADRAAEMLTAGPMSPANRDLSSGPWLSASAVGRQMRGHDHGIHPARWFDDGHTLRFH